MTFGGNPHPPSRPRSGKHRVYQPSIGVPESSQIGEQSAQSAGQMVSPVQGLRQARPTPATVWQTGVQETEVHSPG